MSRARGLIGRDGELAEIAGALGEPVPVLVLVRGPRGSGKTALLSEVAARCRDRGVKALMVRLTRDDQWDLFGARGVMEALRVGFADVGSPRVVAAMNTVRRLCTPAAYESAATRGRLIHHLQRLFDSLHNSAPVVVLFDSLGAASVKVVNAATVASRAGCAPPGSAAASRAVRCARGTCPRTSPPETAPPGARPETRTHSKPGSTPGTSPTRRDQPVHPSTHPA